MKWVTSRNRVAFAGLLASCLAAASWADTFTWQGKLVDTGLDATGVYDFEFSLWDSAAAGLQISGTLVVDDVTIDAGLVTVDLDFGASAFDGDDRWLQIALKADADGAYTTLNPRQPIHPTPYAIRALEAALATEATTATTADSATDATNLNGQSASYYTDASNLVSGVLGDGRLGGLYSNSLHLSNPGNMFEGSFAGDGSAISGVQWNSLSGVPAGFADGVDNDSGGDITGVTAGSGLSGGGSSGSVVLAVATNGVTNTMLGSDAASLNKVSGGSMSASGGNVGIGIASPTARLHLVAPNPEVSLKMRTGGSWTAELKQTDSSYLSLINGGSERMTIAPNGNTGIGTITPTSRLHVVTDGDPAVLIESDSSSGQDTGMSIRGARNATTTSDIAYVDFRNFDDNEGAGVDYIMGRISASMQDVSGETGYMRFYTNAGADLQERMRLDKQGHLTLMKNGSGDAGSSLRLAQLTGGATDDRWEMRRRSTSSGSTIEFNYFDGASTWGVSHFEPIYNATFGLVPNVISGHAVNSGSGNRVTAGHAATIAGGGRAGDPNVVTDDYGTIGGGTGNTAHFWATVAGGSDNQATGASSVVCGGAVNIASGTYSSVPGGNLNAATALSTFAAGNRAKANHSGSFVWADSTAADFGSTGSNQFLIRANGGVAINTTAPLGFDLAVAGTAAKPGGGSWSLYSDRRLKKDIQPLPKALDRLMALRGVTYEYAEPNHFSYVPGEQIGFIAQEVEQVFPEWVNDMRDGYKSVSIAGFEALTVEAMRELRAENEQLRMELNDLRAAVEQLVHAARANEE